MKGEMLPTRAYPPPPPPPPQTSPKKDSRKMLVVVLLIVIIVVSAVVLIYLATNQPSSTNPTPKPSGTPTATPTSSPTGTSTPTPTQTSTVGAATSLQFSVSLTHEGAIEWAYTYMAKNIGASNMMIRVEMTETGSDPIIYIINGAQQKVWIQSGGQWADLSSEFTSQWSSWNSAFTGYRDSLAGWAGAGDWTYTDSNGDTVRLYDIIVNPSLADSLFQHG